LYETKNDTQIKYVVADMYRPAWTKMWRMKVEAIDLIEKSREGKVYQVQSRR